VELKDLRLEAKIGSYGPGDTVPQAHVLDLTLWIDAGLVLIAEDGMQHVFDYDPLVREIDRLARDGHYETQERLVTRIVAACASQPQVDAVEIVLRKTPVLAGSGSLGVRLVIDEVALHRLRHTAAGLPLHL
jgi:dihydroneopterin aldolase